MRYRTSDFDFELLENQIAQVPAGRRDQSRLMVLDRASKAISDRVFSDITGYFQKGDLLVLNNTKVIPARLFGLKADGGARIELLLVRQFSNNTWECLAKPAKRLKISSKIIFGSGELVGEVVEKKQSGEVMVRFHYEGDFEPLLERLGEVPLPPYIKPSQGEELADRYQTVYADKAGASAAPTAGLHFTNQLIQKIAQKGVKIAYITLHTGIGTFQPVRTEDPTEHQMHSEYVEVPKETAAAVKKAKRVIAVGTTTVRALETSSGKPFKGETELFIFPGYEFKVVNAMITNFHFPRSTLLMMVSAFAGRDYILKAYEQAKKKNFRFFSFGDAMLII